MDILKTQISYIANYKTKPRLIELQQVFKAINNPTRTKHLIRKIREVETERQSYLMAGDVAGAEKVKKTKKDPIKNKLPAFIFGAVCEGGHSAEHIVSNTGIVCIDFDSDKSTTPAQWEAFRDNLINVKYVFYTALSVSASGVMALLKIEDPERQAEYFEQMKIDFTGLLKDFNVEGAKLDLSKGSNPAQLRFITHDPNAKYKSDFTIYDRLPKPKPQPVRRKTSTTTEHASDVFELCRKSTISKGFNFERTQDMHYSIFHLCSCLNAFGVDQSEAEHWIDSNILPLREIKSNCITYPYQKYKSDFGKRTFTPYETPSPQPAPTPDPNPYPHGVNEYTGEIFDERGYPADWDDIAPPGEGSAEYREMLLLIQREFDAVIDTSFDPNEAPNEMTFTDSWRTKQTIS